MKENKLIKAIDAAWMNLVGVMPTLANEPSDELRQAVHRVEQARIEAGLQPLEAIADVGTFVLQ